MHRWTVHIVLYWNTIPKAGIVFCFGPKPKFCSFHLDFDQAEQKLGSDPIFRVLRGFWPGFWCILICMQYKNGLTKDFNWGGEIGTRVGARGMKFGTREEYTSVNLGPSFPNTISVFQFGPNLGLKTEVLYIAEQFPHLIILVTCDNYLHELFRFEILVNCFPQYSHFCSIGSLSSEWIFRCLFKLKAVVNCFPQYSQLCFDSSNLSPLSAWVFRCLFRFETVVNCFSQYTHWWFDTSNWSWSEVWICRCLFRFETVAKCFPQYSHFCIDSSICSGVSCFCLLCSLRVVSLVKILSQVLQTNSCWICTSLNDNVWRCTPWTWLPSFSFVKKSFLHSNS